MFSFILCNLHHHLKVFFKIMNIFFIFYLVSSTEQMENNLPARMVVSNDTDILIKNFFLI